MSEVDLLGKLIKDLEDAQRPGGPLEGVNLRIRRRHEPGSVFKTFHRLVEQMFKTPFRDRLNEKMLLCHCPRMVADKDGEPLPIEECSSPEEMRQRLEVVQQIFAVRRMEMDAFVETFKDVIREVEEAQS